MTSFTKHEAEDTARRYNAGVCPCCASYIEEWEDSRHVTYHPESIGEGVVLCGRCIGNKHQEIPGLVEFIMQAIADINSRAIER